MAGLYIHIPFCRTACSYCDFHFSISLSGLHSMLEAIRLEIVREKNYLEGETLQTVYLGGGTPSIIPVAELRRILAEVYMHHDVKPDAEVSLEANPDDLDKDYLEELRGIGINRLSIGIQSFHDEDLKLMDRRHNATRAIECIQEARKAGFSNFNIDLIYGMPGMGSAGWKTNLETACRIKPPHIAAYHLSYEPGTVLEYRLSKGRLKAVSENESLEQYRLMVDMLGKSGYEHYEISNFALPGMRSRHNSSYWAGKKYLGIGPSAHSFNGISRRWNVSGNASYIRGINQGKKVFTEETLEEKDRFHEYLMTSLRTSEGIRLEYIGKEWGKDFLDGVRNKCEAYIQSGIMILDRDILVLTEEGRFIADHVIRELFLG